MPTKKLSDHIAELYAAQEITQDKVRNLETLVDNILEMLKIHKTIVADLIKKVK